MELLLSDVHRSTRMRSRINMTEYTNGSKYDIRSYRNVNNSNRCLLQPSQKGYRLEQCIGNIKKKMTFKYQKLNVDDTFIKERENNDVNIKYPQLKINDYLKSVLREIKIIVTPLEFKPTTTKLNLTEYTNEKENNVISCKNIDVSNRFLLPKKSKTCIEKCGQNIDYNKNSISEKNNSAIKDTSIKILKNGGKRQNDAVVGSLYLNTDNNLNSVDREVKIIITPLNLESGNKKVNVTELTTASKNNIAKNSNRFLFEKDLKICIEKYEPNISNKKNTLRNLRKRNNATVQKISAKRFKSENDNGSIKSLHLNTSDNFESVDREVKIIITPVEFEPTTTKVISTENTNESESNVFTYNTIHYSNSPLFQKNLKICIEKCEQNIAFNKSTLQEKNNILVKKTSAKKCKNEESNDDACAESPQLKANYISDFIDREVKIIITPLNLESMGANVNVAENAKENNISNFANDMNRFLLKKKLRICIEKCGHKLAYNKNILKRQNSVTGGKNKAYEKSPQLNVGDNFDSTSRELKIVLTPIKIKLPTRNTNVAKHKKFKRY